MYYNAELDHRIRYELRRLERTRSEYTVRLDRLRDCKGTVLRRTRSQQGKYYYFIKTPGSAKYRYLGVNRQKEVKKVKEVRFLEEAIRRIDRDIDLMKSLREGFLPFDQNSVNESLPKIYRCDVPPVSEEYQRAGEKWKAGRLEYQKRFPENYPQYKTQTTSDKVKVKSISELVLYERFKSAGLAQVYELPFPADDYGPVLYPDFTILSPVDMKTEIIVEFAGRLDKQGYREDFAKRIGRYIASGYIPGVNLFFIFGDRDGNLDSTQITKVIEDIMGTRKVQAS